MTRASGTPLSLESSYSFIDQCILQEMRTADVSKMCSHPHAGGGGSIMMADAVFLFIWGSWNPGRMGLPCQVPCQAFGPGRCGTAEAGVESIQRGPRCQKDFLAHPFGALKLQSSLVAEDMRCWGRRRWDTGVSSCWGKWLEWMMAIPGPYRRCPILHANHPYLPEAEA